MFIYAKARIGIPPQVNVVGTIIFLTAVGLVAISTLVSRRRMMRDEAIARTARHRRHLRSRSWSIPRRTDRRPRRRSPTCPTMRSCPAVWSRITNLDVDRGEGSWLITRDGQRYLDYSSGIGVTNTGHAHPRVAAAIAAQASQAHPRPAEHRLPRAGPAAVRAAPARPARRAVAGVPVELGRGGGRGLGQARARRDRPAGDPGVPLRLPRPDGPDDGAHDGQGRLPRRVRAAARAPSTTRPIRTATEPPAAPTRPTRAPATGRSSST